MLTNANNLLYASKYQQAIEEYDKVIASSPDQVTLLSAYYNKAQAYDGMGQYSPAAQCYQKIIDIDPKFNNGMLYYEQGQLYQMGRMYAECRRAYENYLKINPKHAQCYFNLGQALETIGEQEQAIRAFQKATELKPNYSKAYLARISILKKLKRNTEILNTCKVALKNEPTDFQILYEEGFSLISLQRYRQAIESLEQCIRNNKKYSKAYIALGDCFYKLQKDKQGLEVLNTCLKLNSDVLKLIEKKEIKVLMGTIYMNMKQYKPAIDCFRQVLSQRPINQNVKIKMAICLQEYGNYFFNNRQFSDALTCYNQSKNYDNRSSVLNNQGLAYQNINNFVDAEKCFNQVLKRDPKDTNALSNLASLYRQMGKTEKSNEILKNLAKQNHDNIGVHINNGRNYVYMHKYSQALPEFQKALAMNKDNNNFHLFNDMAVTLEKLNRNQEALEYANKANDLTKNRSPLFLLNRASILMGLSRNHDAKVDFDRAAEQLRNPDKQNLTRLGISADNIRYMFTQLNRFAYLMTPINDFRKEAMDQIAKLALKNAQRCQKIVQKVDKAETYAMNRIITQIKKDNPQETPNPQQSRQDYNTVVKMMESAKAELKQLRQIVTSQKQIIQTQDKEMKAIKHELNMLKLDSNQIKQKLRYLPQSISLSQKLDSLYSQGDIPIWQYGKQLYWILNSYLKSYMLIYTGVVAKGDNIDRSTLNKAIKCVGQINQYVKAIPVINQFSELISRVCGLFVDMQDDAIIEKVYQMISYNYNTEEDLNNEICEAVLAVLTSPSKINKVREKLTFQPSKGLLESFADTMSDVIQWFSQKKNQFVMHMRGYQKAENIVQSELAVIDVGAIISIILNMSSDSKVKNRPILNAAKKICVGEEVQSMILLAYKRENESIRVSNNSFCTVMRCQILYDNPLLNYASFIQLINQQHPHLLEKVTNLSHEKFDLVSDLMQINKYDQIIELLLDSRV